MNNRRSKLHTEACVQADLPGCICGVDKPMNRRRGETRRTQNVLPNIRLVREVRKSVPVAQITEPGVELTASGPRAVDTTTVQDGHEEIWYETVIDLDLLNGMAHKAARSKAGRAVDGPLIVRVVDRRRI